MSKKIIAGPWFGEIGWELLRWQGIFRNLAYKGYKIVMASRPGHEALYQDYIEDYIGIEADPRGEPDGWKLSGQVIRLQKALLDQYPGYKYMDPTTCVKIGVDPLGSGQKFIKYGQKSNIRFDIAIHARSTNKCGTDIRNWPVGNWNSLIEKLKNYNIVLIGSSSGAISKFKIPKGRNPIKQSYIGASLGSTIDALASSRLVIGPSSGPMHLASLCGTPHLLWTDNKFWGSCNGTNRDRYEKNWNPLGTKAIVLDHCNWQPTVDEVYTKIIKELNDG